MISRERAEQLATEYIESRNAHIVGGVSILKERTIKKPYGWIFFFNSTLFLQTRDLHQALFGNCPFVVESSDGRITPLGIAGGLAQNIAAFERKRGFST